MCQIERKLLTALVVALAVAFSAATQVAAAPKKSEYVYLMGSTPHYAPIVVGVRKGFCGQLGLNVRFKKFTSGGTASQSFLAGQGDFVNAGEWPAARTWMASKGKVVGLHPVMRIEGLMVAMARKNIKNAQDLKGKKIAAWLGTSSEYFAALYLDKKGIKTSDVKFINVKPVEMVIALDKGDIDAFFIWQPFGWKAEEVSGDKVHTLDTGKGYLASYMVTSVRKGLFDDDPDAAKAMVECSLKGAAYATKNLDEAAEIVGKEFKLPPADTKRMIEGMDMDVPFTPQFRKDMDGVNIFMKSKGKSKADINWGSMFDQRAMQAVNPSLVRN